MDNPKIKSVSILCGYCKTRFPSPMFIGDINSFESTATARIKVRCPACRQLIDCNKENMAYVLADDSGGLVGRSFGDKPSDP